MYIRLMLLNIFFGYAMSIPILKFLLFPCVKGVNTEVIARNSVELGQIGRITNRTLIQLVINRKRAFFAICEDL